MRWCTKCRQQSEGVRRTGRPLPYRYLYCRNYFCVKTLTLMHCSNQSLQVWTAKLCLMCSCLTSLKRTELICELGRSLKLAWRLSHRIQAARRESELARLASLEADRRQAQKARETQEAAGYLTAPMVSPRTMYF